MSSRRKCKLYLGESTFGSGVKEFPQIKLQEKRVQSKKKIRKYSKTPSRGISQMRNHVSSASLKTREIDILKSRARNRIGKN